MAARACWNSRACDRQLVCSEAPALLGKANGAFQGLCECFVNSVPSDMRNILKQPRLSAWFCTLSPTSIFSVSILSWMTQCMHLGDAEYSRRSLAHLNCGWHLLSELCLDAGLRRAPNGIPITLYHPSLFSASAPLAELASSVVS